MKIAVAMSGGVDSSAAAAILKEQGHELVGFTMQLWDQRRGINVTKTAIRCLPVAVRSTTFTTRAASPKSWLSVLRAEPRARFRARRGPTVRFQLSQRRDADPVCRRATAV